MRLLGIFLATGAFCVIVLYGTFKWMNSYVSTPITLPHPKVTVDIPSGTTFEQTLEIMHNSGVLKQVMPLRIYLKVNGGIPTVQASTYEFTSPISPLDAMEVLRQGGKAERLTVVEGWTRWDIAEAMVNEPAFKLKSSDEALALMDKSSLISDLDPSAKNLEGYLFPDTYFLVVDTTPENMISRMVEQFRQVRNGHFKNITPNSSPSLHDVVTVASIIETEAKLAKERPIVASVIYNRIKKEMPLGVDSTVVYAAKLAGKWRNNGIVYQSDIDRVSPYNTRNVKGLPPGPVGSPGLSSIMAAIHPANTDYLYYVRNPDRNDGAHNFYSDEAGFEQGVLALRKWEKKNRPQAVKTK